MSLYSALYAGVSGLTAQSSAMATVADNITNVNTVGYKGTSAQFTSLVTDSGASASYSAGGVSASPQSLISKQGLLQASSSLTDIAIDGAGFFVVRDSADSSGTIAYTRAGSFTTDSSGYLRNTAGYYLMGWPLNADGTYTDDGTSSSLEAIQPAALTGAARATTSIDFRANLDSSSDAVTTYTAGDMANGTVTPEFTRSVTVYDAQGNEHSLSLSFVRTGTNTWAAELTGEASEISDVGGTAVTDGMIASGTIAFNSDGSLDVANSDPSFFSDLDITWSNGAASDPISLDLGSQDGLDGLTQFASSSALLSANVDGGMLGTVSSVEISEDGIVSAVFDDGTSLAIYQLPIATFQNPDGLTAVSGNAYIASQASGNAAINTPGSLGGGTLAAGSLEASNVDLATEFSNMILFQRAYSASSKIITTVDDMLQEVSNLKR
ncbi:flagellar hook protein FlgE [Novosphingobium profundi]|uniref:flagellar hook protein FlgE n=1 Tax=Novosphingobium profundi TaxID=1774954 RepID=UPI001BD96D5D|nr:flagellar hook protein FlgE [Novosphingobium profundi]MBT0670567.1 flagellar hook protein FlgE [Novosphingobium profundi]